jgi:2-polyprenyl-3-methyl-5-hydroxy-6-metoxy-1,4-benzoquinol methylase/uncharacterized protein YbaR (Trm112 family)
MDQWYLDNLVCPVDKLPLSLKNGHLLSSSGKKYPIVDGVPVMLVDNVEQTMPLATPSLERAKNTYSDLDTNADNLYLDLLGISEDEKRELLGLAALKESTIDPVVSFIIVGTCGYAYQRLVGKLKSYPIPEIRLPDGNGKLLLDIGCNWGRWSIAASRKGYTVIGIDPSMGGIMAARRVAKELGCTIRYIVGDSRFLPFRDSLFDSVFSYSVLQHLGKNHVIQSLYEIRRVLNSHGTSLIQMANFLGIRSLQHQLKRSFREAIGFEVRYWSIPELRNTFNQSIGNSDIFVDCYFGLGLQKSDMKYMSVTAKTIITASEILKKLATPLPFMKYFADSVYVQSQKNLNG